jgi:hypothetical protein
MKTNSEIANKQSENQYRKFKAKFSKRSNIQKVMDNSLIASEHQFL